MNPGFEKFVDRESWSAERVQDDISKWSFRKDGDKHRRRWKLFFAFFKRNQEAEDHLGEGHTSIPVADGGDSFPTNIPTWDELWTTLASVNSSPPPAADETDLTGSTALVLVPQPANLSTALVTSAPVAPPRRTGKAPDRAEVGRSKKLDTLNAVRHSGFTRADAARTRLLDQAEWIPHLASNFDTAKQLWFVRLDHNEGEFPVGLGERTFQKDDTENETYGVHWCATFCTLASHAHSHMHTCTLHTRMYQLKHGSLAKSHSHMRISNRYERKNKKTHAWGTRPGFKKLPRHHPSRTSEEPKEAFIPVIVEMGAQSQLTQACMSALREWFTSDPEALRGVAEENEDGEDGEDGEVTHSLELTHSLTLSHTHTHTHTHTYTHTHTFTHTHTQHPPYYPFHRIHSSCTHARTQEDGEDDEDDEESEESEDSEDDEESEDSEDSEDDEVMSLRAGGGRHDPLEDVPIGVRAQADARAQANRKNAPQEKRRKTVFRRP